MSQLDGDLVASIVDNVLERADRVRSPSAGLPSPAQTPDLDAKTVPSSSGAGAGGGGEDFIEYVGLRGMYGGPAERTRLVGQEPGVDALRVEGVATEGE